MIFKAHSEILALNINDLRNIGMHYPLQLTIFLLLLLFWALVHALNIWLHN